MIRASGHSIFALLTILAFAQGFCHAQNSAAAPPPVPMEEIPTPQADGFRLDLQAPKRTTGFAASATSNRYLRTNQPADSERAIRKLDEAERRLSERIKRIQENLTRLQDLMQATEPGSTRAQDDAAVPVTPIPADAAAEEQQPSGPIQINNAVTPSAMPVPEVTPTDESQDVAAPIKAPVLVTSTVDSLSLANNLFAQGKIDEARPIYEQLLELSSKPTDRIWIQYQLASCYRIQGDIKRATKLYRLLAGTKDGDYWRERALWWLDYLRRSQRLNEQRQQLETKLESLRKATHGVQQQ
jgi:tetratricopeptide (TPR) repeat protein